MNMNTVEPLEELLGFIANAPASETPGDRWDHDRWQDELDKAIPDWRNQVKHSQSWKPLSTIKPQSAHDGLFEILLDVAGLGLARLWFNNESAYSKQKRAAENWFKQPVSIRQWDKLDLSVQHYLVEKAPDALWDNLTIAIWQSMNEDMKNSFVVYIFNRYPGEPMATVQRYLDEIHWSSHRWRRRHFLHADSTIHAPTLSAYSPSPQVQKLLLTVKDARDSKYVQRINNWQDSQAIACKSMHLPRIFTQTNTNYELSRAERALVAILMDKANQGGFEATTLPSILLSAEAPPVFVSHPELEDAELADRARNMERFHKLLSLDMPKRRAPEIISIEKLLGVYRFRSQEIVLFERGIDWYCQRHSCDKDQLLAVVLIHELGHWIMHQLPKPGVPVWDTDLYAQGDTKLHEGWAQLMTDWVAQTVGGDFKGVFEQLNRGQSSAYHVFKQFQNEPVDKVMRSLERLRFLRWPGRVDDWKNSLK